MIPFRDLIPCKCENRLFRQLNCTRTLMYYNPTFNEDGVNINPDRNKTYTIVQCSGCKHAFEIIDVLGEYELLGVYLDSKLEQLRLTPEEFQSHVK